MNTIQSNFRRWLTVVLFATAMAWVESAVVFYIRTLVDRLEPHQPDPLPLLGTLGPVELVRELATLLMHFMVGWLAGRTWRERLGYMAVCFGVWDIAYYAFLKIMCGWPHSLLDWDILFLLPLPWWGPVLAPMLIALLMIVWGTLASRAKPAVSAAPNWSARGLGLLGVLFALYVFMADAIRVAPRGVDALRALLPTQFNWPLYCLALMLMALPVLHRCRSSIERVALGEVE
jgi:hypothetical protein